MSTRAARGLAAPDASISTWTLPPHSAVTFTSAAISAIASLYWSWRIAGFEMELLSVCVDHGLLRKGLATFERACRRIRVTEELAGVVRQHRFLAPWSVVEIRCELLGAFAVWLEDARRVLPSAALRLGVLTGGPNDEVSSALEALELMSSASAGEGSAS